MTLACRQRSSEDKSKIKSKSVSQSKDTGMGPLHGSWHRADKRVWHKYSVMKYQSKLKPFAEHIITMISKSCNWVYWVRLVFGRMNLVDCDFTLILDHGNIRLDGFPSQILVFGGLTGFSLFTIKGRWVVSFTLSNTSWNMSALIRGCLLPISDITCLQLQFHLMNTWTWKLRAV